MKKIAILTQPIGFNYGGIIQNYALQTVLKNRGVEVETIARENNKKSKFRILLSKIKNETYNRLKGIKRKIFSDTEKQYMSSEMLRFIKEQISVSKKIYTTQDLASYFKEQDFNAVVVGSDQTWRPMYSPDIYNYFLDFLVANKTIKKIAYASSFGTEKWEYTDEQTERCKELIKAFDAVSVREISGVSLCEKYLKTDSKWVLDPTLLLGKEQYISLFQNIKNIHKGLFNYVLDKEENKQQFITDIAFQLKLPSYSSQPKRSLSDTKGFSTIEDYKYPSLEVWLKSFYDADFVITDSFHGTVFSIIFNKPFLSIVNEERGASRFYSLLEQLGLQDRLITDYKKFDKRLLNSDIDYSSVSKKLEDLKKQSFQFIDKNIS